MPPFKDEHILLIAPGSQVTLAQLGLPESFTPAKFRFPTRMFPAEKKGEYEPYKIRERIRGVKVSDGAPTSQEDVEMKDADPSEQGKQQDAEGDGKDEDSKNEKTTQPEKEQEGTAKLDMAEEVYYEEDVSSDEGAIYPLENGRIIDWPCFFALITHIYNTLSPPFHTPVMIIAEPVWTARDREAITQFVFEKFKTPAFSLIDSALAVCYGYGVSTATVVDVGKGKADVTAVTDFIVNEHGRGIALEGCGGDYMTARLLELLNSKGYTREMCEQLKRSNITEILPLGSPLPGAATGTRQDTNAIVSAPTGALEGSLPIGNIVGSIEDSTPTSTVHGSAEGDEDDGLLDVATIVSGNTSEFLAQRERERADRLASRKGPTDQVTKPARLPNSKREKASFQFEEFVPLRQSNGSTAGTGRFARQTRDIEVGTERFLSCTPMVRTRDRLSSGILEDIATQIRHTILAVPDATKRSELWDSLIIVGNGSKIKGFTQALLATITHRFVLSPSATIFTSEIPSNFSTPLPTGGTNTPALTGHSVGQPMAQPGFPHAISGHGVNPLLVAATHANSGMSNAHAGTPGLDPSGGLHFRSTGHSQTPTSVKTLKPPEYFPEWKEHGSSNAPGASPAGNKTEGSTDASGNTSNPGGPGAPSAGHGLEEAFFLGAQVASKVVFVLDQGVNKGFMTRVEYNESGPSTIHEYAM